MGTDRYKFVKKNDGAMQNVPRILISSRSTDKFVVYDSSKTRLDRIASDMYLDDSYNWLILLCNPEFSIEFDIPSGTVIRIGLPLKDVLQEYKTQIITNKDK